MCVLGHGAPRIKYAWFPCFYFQFLVSFACTMQHLTHTHIPCLKKKGIMISSVKLQSFHVWKNEIRFSHKTSFIIFISLTNIFLKVPITDLILLGIVLKTKPRDWTGLTGNRWGDRFESTNGSAMHSNWCEPVQLGLNWWKLVNRCFKTGPVWCAT